MFTSKNCNNCNNEINSKNTYYKGSDLTFCSLTCRIIKLNELKLNELKLNELKLNELKLNELKLNELKLNELKLNELKLNELKNQNLSNKTMKRNISYSSIMISEYINLPISPISPIVNNKIIITKNIYKNLDIFKIPTDNKIHNIVCNCLCFIAYISTIYIINYCIYIYIYI